MKTTVIKILNLLVFLSLFLPGLAFASNLAGHVEKVSGTAWAQLGNEPRRQLEQGSPFYVSDTLTTEPESTLELQFEDKTRFFVGSDAEMAVEEFIFNSAEQENSFSSRILKGTFRFVTGLIAREKPEDMEVNTSVATIGVRGTQVIGEAAATSATIILLEPEDKSRKSIIQVANQYGSVTIDEPGYGTEIPDEHSPPSPPRRMRMQTIDNLMRSIQSIQRIRVPRPHMP